MFFYKRFTLVFLSALILSACDSAEDNAAPTSSDVIFTTASVLGSNVNDPAAIDAGPEVSFDGLELYFHSDRAGGSGGLDLYVSKRATTDETWGAAVNLGATINSDADDRAASLSKDGLTLVIASDRTGTIGGYDLYLSTRASVNDAWSAPANLGNVVNTSFNESGADLNVDGLVMFFHSDRSGFGSDDLYGTNRATLSDPWAPPVNLGSNVNSADFDTAPEAASDLLTLYFHSTRAGGVGPINIWKSTRATINDVWGVPALMPAPVNTASSDLGVGLSGDWKTIYFASDFGGNRDIWKAEP